MLVDHSPIAQRNAARGEVQKVFARDWESPGEFRKSPGEFSKNSAADQSVAMRFAAEIDQTCLLIAWHAPVADSGPSQLAAPVQSAPRVLLSE